MSIQLGQIAPNFIQDSTEGRFDFHGWLGNSWGVLFSHPRNFTPVCTTELGEVARLQPEWARAKRVLAKTHFYSSSLFRRVFAILGDPVKSQNALGATSR